MNPDWMTLRYTVLDPNDTGLFFERYFWNAKFDSLHVTLDRNQLTERHWPDVLGRITRAHGGLHLALTGAYWRRPYANLALGELHGLLLKNADTCSLSRLDWAVQVHAGSAENVLPLIEELTQQCLAILPEICPSPQGYMRDDRRSATGVTTYVGKRGKDSDKARSRSPYVRNYHRYDTQVVRSEIEWKHIPGDDVATQWQVTHDLSSIIFKVLFPNTEHHLFDGTPLASAPARSRSNADQLWARLAGVAWGYAARQGIDAKDFTKPLAHLATLMGVSDSCQRAARKKYLDKPAKQAAD